jgi:hypothetical protein
MVLAALTRLKLVQPELCAEAGREPDVLLEALIFHVEADAGQIRPE